MTGDISARTTIYVICGYTDMRKSIDGLCDVVMSAFHEGPSEQSVYLFCGRRCDRIKILLRDPDGMCLLYKRLDPNLRIRFHWPRNRNEVRPITWEQFDWLMSGLKIDQTKPSKKAS